MSTSDAPAQTRLFNRTTQARVLVWGAGVIMPGESFLTDRPESYAPDEPGSPWTVDEEAGRAVAAILRTPQVAPTSPPPSGSDGHSEPAGGLSEANQGIPGLPVFTDPAAPPDLAISPMPQPTAEELTAEAERLTAEAERLTAAAEAANTAEESAANPQE